MRIGGLQKCSLIDYPGKISAIIFTLGCNFKCSYCHNPELIKPELFPQPISEDEIFSFLAGRKGKLDAVTITGGEPTLQTDLLDFILKIRKLGFLVKLDSNGSKPGVLKNVISSGAIDYIAMDVKAPPGKYQEITNSRIDPETIKKSIKPIMNSKKDYEFRTTITAHQLNEGDILEIGKLIGGAKLYVLQKFVPTAKNKLPGFKSYPDGKLMEFQKAVSHYVEKCIIR